VAEFAWPSTQRRSAGAWAAAEMWETTGDASALADFESRAQKFSTGTTSYVDSDFDWGNVKNLGMYVYLQSKRTGRSDTVRSAIQKSLTTAADTLVGNRNNSGYGRALSGKSGQYYWGSNGAVARTCMLLQVANRLAPKADYLDTCVDQISWIFGRNYYNRSQVTGIGLNPPMHPHHRPSQADGIADPWPGLLVGGGNNTSKQASSSNGATNWIDDVNDYELNEVAINWNAPLVYALAGFLGPDKGQVVPGDAAVLSDAMADAKISDAKVSDDVLALADVVGKADQAPPGPDTVGNSDQATASGPDAGPDTGVAVPDAPVGKDTSVGADSAPSPSTGSANSGCSCSVGGTGSERGAVLLLGVLAIAGMMLRRRASHPNPRPGCGD
jgi:MYXO-CTERM domain-containing protein